MVPLTKIIFFIAINILPSGQQAFQISTPEGELFTYTKQEDGGWNPSPVPEEGKGVWSVKDDTLFVKSDKSWAILKMSQFFDSLETINWSNVVELENHQVPIKLVRNKDEVTVQYGSPRKAWTYIIKW